jgi:hypothetical protein
MIINDLEIKSTDYHCADKFARLECPSDFMIFVSGIYYKRTQNQCNVFEEGDEILYEDEKFQHCIGVETNNAAVSERCNGQQICNVRIEKKSHKSGFYGTNCDFQSNIANIFYVCVPGKT